MVRIGIRELKAGLSRYLKRVSSGERITVTDHGRPVAILEPPVVDPKMEALQAMVASGEARWVGGKPPIPTHPAKLLFGPTMAETIIEDRG